MSNNFHYIYIGFSLSYDIILQVLVYYAVRVNILSHSSPKHPAIIIDMANRLSLIFGVFFIVLIQFCHCAPNEPKSKQKYAEVLKFNFAQCSERKYKAERVGKNMENVCQEFFNGQNSARGNKEVSWMNGLDKLPPGVLPEEKISRPYYLIIPHEYDRRNDLLIPGKIFRCLLDFLI